MKKLLVAGLVVVVLVAGALVFAYTNLGSIIRRAVEGYGTQATQAKVTLDAADVSVTSGQGSLRGLVIANPEGYAGPVSFRLDHIGVTLDTGTVTSDVVVVKEVVIEAPKVYCEFGSSLTSNLKAIQKNVEAFGRSVAAEPDGGRRDRKRAKSDGAPERRYIVDDLRIRGGRVELSSSLAKGKSVGADIPEVHVTGIGRARGGATPAELTAEILEHLTRSRTRSRGWGSAGTRTSGSSRSLLRSGLRDNLRGRDSDWLRRDSTVLAAYPARRFPVTNRSPAVPLGEPMVTAEVVSTFLGCDRSTVYRLASSGALPSVEVAPRVLRFRPEDVRAFVERNTRQMAIPEGRVAQLLGRANG